MPESPSTIGRTDAELYDREYELRKILDRDKTDEQLEEVDRLKAAIRKRFSLPLPAHE